MVWYAISGENVLKNLSTFSGLDADGVARSRQNYGENVIKKQKADGVFKRIISALFEPMILILLVSAVITFAINLGRFLKTGEADFSEVIGIVIAVFLSTAITVIMENGSQKAFESLASNSVQKNVSVLRNGVNILVQKEEVVVGDIIYLSAGDAVVADGRLIDSTSLTVDESALTGESLPVKKNHDCILTEKTHLAERLNMVYAGTFIVGGDAKCVVTGVGNSTEIGKIAQELGNKTDGQSPLNEKLSSLGKSVAIIGVITSMVVFVLSVVKLIATGKFTFFALQETFISCIVLIVATVPEGLPSIVAVSLAIGMVKLSKKNALIKKLVATETVGAVSVICSDKTGTLTQNKMQVERLVPYAKRVQTKNQAEEFIRLNIAVNSTALINGKNVFGNATEGALLTHLKENGFSPEDLRSEYKVTDRIPFSSQEKMMQTTIVYGGESLRLVKGAPEVVLKSCELSEFEKNSVFEELKRLELSARRIICFAHSIGGKTFYDGYAVIFDALRKDAYFAVKKAKTAGIEVKMLTGDNLYTAIAVARELEIINSDAQAVNATDLERLSDKELKNVLPKIKVIARSTPATKLRVVKVLKSMGEVVAVTGDGINDAPAIRHSDVGIAMGIAGAEITKETADVVLLDDGFSTIITAVEFGRNVYKNLQRFILFQLSVNVSALLIIVSCLVFGLPSPFNTLQLLWINIIMDGPPALTLGLESATDDLLKNKPVKRSDGLVSKSMLIRILISAIYIAVVTVCEYSFDFLRVGRQNIPATVFTLFITFQLFNAFNARQTNSQSILKNFAKNKIMPITFLLAFVLQYLIVTFFYEVFGVSPMSFSAWFKTVCTAFTIILLTEGYKFAYRTFYKKNRSFLIKKGDNA